MGDYKAVVYYAITVLFMRLEQDELYDVHLLTAKALERDTGAFP